MLMRLDPFVFREEFYLSPTLELNYLFENPNLELYGVISLEFYNLSEVK